MVSIVFAHLTNLCLLGMQIRLWICYSHALLVEQGHTYLAYLRMDFLAFALISAMQPVKII